MIKKDNDYKSLAGEPTKTVWIAWRITGLDEICAENRVPYAVCENERTAARVGKGKSIGGTDCKVTEATVFGIGSKWFVPVDLIRPCKEDVNYNPAADDLKVALQAALDAGMTPTDIMKVGVNLRAR